MYYNYIRVSEGYIYSTFLGGSKWWSKHGRVGGPRICGYPNLYGMEQCRQYGWKGRQSWQNTCSHKYTEQKCHFVNILYKSMLIVFWILRKKIFMGLQGLREMKSWDCFWIHVYGGVLWPFLTYAH